MTATDFFTPSALRVLRVVGTLSAIGLGMVLGVYIYRAGYERGLADAQPTFAVPSLYRWLAGEPGRGTAGVPPPTE